MKRSVATNVILQGDNLVLLTALPTASVDCVYLDPPFFSDARYTVIAKDGEARTFDDHWPAGIKDYIRFMRERAAELWRILKRRGSLWLHCDDHAKHYLKVMLDELVGFPFWRGDIYWKRSTGHAQTTRGFARTLDTILWYARTTPRFCWLTNLWEDIQRAPPSERVGYPTQKPVALLERIIGASTDVGDVVLDPFCGSGTTLVAAARLGRRWIGLDESAVACRLARERVAKVGAR